MAKKRKAVDKAPKKSYFQEYNFEITLLFSKNGIITLTAEIIEATLEDQKIDFANDVGFEFIPDLQDKEITWGKKTN